MPVNQMHAGEEILYALIPFFAGLMLYDIIKRRKLRRQAPGEQAERPPDEESPEPPAERGSSDQA